jgi:hypothetical protein
MPGTPAALDLSAALEDAEGRALVEDILRRKQASKAADVQVWIDPAKEWKVARDASIYAELFNEPGELV